VLAYGEEVKNLAPVKVALVNPGATATQMRAKAYPGEDQALLKPPGAVAAAVVEMLKGNFETGFRLEVKG
jgi:short-subunit dehydrogenase